MKVVAIIGARPQFIKHYPFEREAIKSLDLVTIHTGQHYDENMSKVFFDQLGMQKPDYLLSLGGGSHGMQTGKMMIEIEQIVQKEKPDAVVVYGDTNSTLAGALVAGKLHIPIVHIEAGLRSHNKEMPEEINRVLTDHISDLLLVPSQKSVDNLNQEGITKGVHVVGDIMKDLIVEFQQKGIAENKSLDEGYFYVTLHRPYNVDSKERLKEILTALAGLKENSIFTAHPRTRKRIEDFGLSDLIKGSKIKVIDPQPYFENLSYLFHSNGLITDSGGMQKEAYWMEKPCCTIRSETEWVETQDHSANVLIFKNLDYLKQFPSEEIIYDKNLYGDGFAAKRIVNLLKSLG
ncbi:MAG: UDP-N-acetylglucosamine 2-epimerase (non-hydrolyzing) [Saprospiraceae bacterium]|nr:UDP-N-acetylglucosamine 2-epimerase (non-hydrolyzing) [Saprospiraceae bacterium]